MSLAQVWASRVERQRAAVATPAVLADTPDMQLGIRVNPASHTPLAEQIAERIRRLAKTGRLPAGTVLPSVRTLADELDVNFATTSRAYKLLRGEGVVAKNKSHRMIVSEQCAALTDLERARLVEPLLLAVRAQARELRVSDAALRGEVMRVLGWDEVPA